MLDMKPIISKSNEGKEIYKFMVDNFYINRSLSGQGTRKFLVNIKKKIKNLKIKEIRSGTKVFDWTVPDEWNVTDGYIMKRNGEKIINFKENNLHIVGYSAPVNQMMNFKELKKKFILLKSSQVQFHILLHIIRGIGVFVCHIILLKK